MRMLPLVALLLVSSACPRLSAPVIGADGKTPDARRAVGTVCDEAAQCAGGVCEDHVCCERACVGIESCALDGHKGQCVARVKGSGCAEDSDCPADAPACDRDDGICCSAHCEGDCRSCKLADHVGECLVAPDNSNPRGLCTGECRACVAAQCAPAFPGTACGEKLACNGLGDCKARGGEPCQTNEDCAVGSCVLGLCLRRSIEAVDSTVVPITDNDRGEAETLDVDALGGVVIATRSMQAQFNEAGDWQRFPRTLWVVTSAGTEWTAQLLELCSEDWDINAVAKIGVVPIVFQAFQHTPFPDCFDRAEENTLIVSILDEDGTLQHRIKLVDLQPGHELVFLRSASSWAGQVAALMETIAPSGDTHFTLVTRAGSGAFDVADGVDVGPFAGVGTVVFLDGKPVLIGAFSSGERVRAATLEDPVTRIDGVEVPETCEHVGGVHAATAILPDGPVAYVLWSCDSENEGTQVPMFAEYHPRRTNQPWTTPNHVAATDSVEEMTDELAVVALADGAPAFAYLTRMPTAARIARRVGGVWVSEFLATYEDFAAGDVERLRALTVGSRISLVVHATTGEENNATYPLSARTMMLTLHP